MLSETKKLEKVVRNWLGGYVEVGSALDRLAEIHGRKFGRYVGGLGLTYNRAKQLMYATSIATECEQRGLTLPHNEATASRLYRLQKSPNVGMDAAMAVWSELTAEISTPTVAELNTAIDKKYPPAPKPVVNPKPQDYVGKAVSFLQDAVNLLQGSTDTVDLTEIEKLVKELKGVKK